MKKISILLCAILILFCSCRTLDSYQPDAYTKTVDTHPLSEDEREAIASSLQVARQEQLDYFKELEKEYSQDILTADPENLIEESINSSRTTVLGSSNFRNAITYYTYIDGLIYDVYFNPDHVTDIRLQEGETLNSSLVMGNPDLWIAEHIDNNESGKVVTHLLIRPLQVNIETDCMVATNKRVYYFRLISTPKTPQLCVCFRYPLAQYETEESSTNYTPFVVPLGEEESATGLGKTVADLNFNYKIKGKASWKPIRVYSDTVRTYIQFDNSFLTNSESPYVFLRKKGEDELVNFTANGVTYICPLILANDELLVLKSGKTEVLIGY